jgi:predicted nucleic acid-binding protein
VLTEFLAFVSNYGGVHRAAAVKLVRNAISRWKILPADRSLFMDGLDFYGERVDKSYSLVDCMSMVLMKQRGIQHVLTNDHHFTQERFTAINQ